MIINSFIKKTSFIVFTLISINIQANIDPGIDFDLNKFINDKLDLGEKTITIPAGRYRVSTTQSYHIQIKNRNDVTIIADGVEMICTETVQAIKIEDCKNLKIQGLSIDYDPLPFTQGRIVEISTDKKNLTVDLIDGYSSTITGTKLEIFDAISGQLTTSTYYGVTYQTNLQTRRVIITKTARNWSSMMEKIGDIVVLDSQGSRFIPHTINPVRCTDLILENVTVYAGTSFAFFETECSNSKYINCKVDRRPIDFDVKSRGTMRMRSNNADAFHSKFAKIGPSYTGCIARYNGDDGFAINGNFHIITETKGNILTVVGKGGQTPDLFVNDVVELVSYSGERIPNAKIIKIETGRPLNTQEINFLTTQTFSGSADKTHQASNVYYITIDRNINLPLGSLINDADRIGNGFEIRNCIAGPNRSRGIIVKSGDGIITANTCINNWGHGIKLAPEYNWLEAGSGNNIIVSNNTISGCHDAAIGVYSIAGNGEFAPIGAHDNIQINNNNILNSSNPGITVTSTSNLCIENNTITSSNNNLLLPWYLNEFGRNEDANREIYLINNSAIDCISLNLDNKTLKTGIHIYPNPTNNFLNIIFEKNYNNPCLKILDVSGKEVMTKELIQTKNEISLSSLSNGIYIIQLKDNGKLIDTYKIVLSKN